MIDFDLVKNQEAHVTPKALHLVLCLHIASVMQLDVLFYQINSGALHHSTQPRRELSELKTAMKSRYDWPVEEMFA